MQKQFFKITSWSLVLATFALVGVSLISSSCEKKRGLTFAQGVGQNLFEISQYKGQTFKVKTGAKRFKGQTSKADELVTIDGFDKINSLDVVEFSIDEGLFADIDMADFNFFGRPDYEYTLKYSFTDHYVVLSKVAAKKDLPSQELTYATNLGNDQYEVPLMGLPLSLFTVEKVLDDRGKDTRRLSTFAKDHLDQATHFKINQGKVRYFDVTGKPDLFTADFFNPDDEWFFTKTLVGRSIASQEILGDTLASLKIKFARTNNSLIGVDLNIAKEQEVLDKTKTITALEIPVEWVDFRLETAGDDARLKEVKLGDKEDAARFWKERKYGLIDFNNADRLDKAFTLDNKLEKLEVGDDYISFTIYESVSGNTYKYSLSKSNRKVKGQTLFAEDAKLFHYFTKRRKVIEGRLFTQDQDIDKLVYGSRFYPVNKEIVYHISKNSPEDKDFTDAVAASVKAWDNAYQEAQTGIRVRLAPERVELGDVRYNTIVLYGYEIDPGRLLGFGPSVQDSRTGETYSAAVHIYLRSYREGLIGNIRNFVRNELGLYDDKKIEQVPYFAETDQVVATGSLLASESPSLSGLMGLETFLTSGETFERMPVTDRLVDKLITPRLRQAIDEKKSKKTANKSEIVQNARGVVCDFSAVAAQTNSWSKIRSTCLGTSSKFKDYLDRLKTEHQSDANITNLDGEEEAILDCAQPLMKDLLTSTLIHEIGHNLGLGHNFAASSDGKNFARTSDGSISYPSSSVMDYPDRDYDMYDKAGPYDIAAIRFLYARKIETKAGEFIDIPPQAGIFATARKLGKEPKAYRMCTDYELFGENYPMFDPLCSRWDVGSKPQEYVRWAISQIHADLIQNGYRYNDKGFSGAQGSLVYFLHFQQIHEYFRQLMVRKAGVYFEKLGKIDETALLEKIKETSDPALTLDYYEAVKMIFEFSQQIMNLSSHICLVEDADGKVLDILEFRPLRDKIFEKSRVTVQNCTQAATASMDVLRDLQKPYVEILGATKFLDRGREIDGLELDLDPAAAADKIKAYAFRAGSNDLDPRYSSGTLALKASAMSLLMNRVTLLPGTRDAGVSRTSFLDFPWFAEKLYNEAWSKLLDGVDGGAVDPVLTGVRLQHYLEYMDFNPGYLASLVKSGLVPTSPAYPFAASMKPRIEKSSITFEAGPAKSERPIWYTSNTQNEIVYAESGVAAEIISLFVRMQQVDVFKNIYFLSLGKDPELAPKVRTVLTTLLTSIRDSQVTPEDRIMLASEAFMKGQSKGQLRSLQPAQRMILRKLIQEELKGPSQPEGEVSALVADGVEGAPAEGAPIAAPAARDEGAILMQVVNNFSLVMLDQRLLDLAEKDPDNFQALYSTLNAFLSSF